MDQSELNPTTRNVIVADFAHKRISTNSDMQKLITQIVRETRRHKFSYEQLKKIFREVRRQANVPAPKNAVKLLRLPTNDEIKQFFAAVDDPLHKLIFKLALSTGLRIAELANVRVEEIDLEKQILFVNQGKNSRDRIVVFPRALKEELAIYLSLSKSNMWLFESQKDSKFTTRRLQQICKEYSLRSGIKMHFHLMRHIWNTRLAEAGLSEDQRKVLAGHSPGSDAQKIYTHLALAGIKDQALAALDSITF